MRVLIVAIIMLIIGFVLGVAAQKNGTLNKVTEQINSVTETTTPE